MRLSFATLPETALRECAGEILELAGLGEAVAATGTRA
jgi:hypothetical protein